MGYFVHYDYGCMTVKSYRNRSFLYSTLMLSLALLLLPFAGHCLSVVLQAILMGQGRGVLEITASCIQDFRSGASWQEAVNTLRQMIYYG